jgi:hypothetical protein
MIEGPEPSLLGLPDQISAGHAHQIVQNLRLLWPINYGEEPASLEADLISTQKWFDPVAQGQRLRRELFLLPPAPEAYVDPGSPMTLQLAPSKYLVTPEGRCVIDLIESLPPAFVEYSISRSQLLRYDRRLGRLYKEWSRHRILSVVGLLAGTTKPLQIPAAGVVIALLANRCDSEDRALTRFASGPERELVDRAFFAPVQEFKKILNPKEKGNPANPRLVSGWMLYEARRRLGEGLVVVDARNKNNGRVWVEPKARREVIDVIARDLVRGNRAKATVERFSLAFDALVARLRKELPSLAAFGLVHERPQATAELRSELISSLEKHTAGPLDV